MSDIQIVPLMSWSREGGEKDEGYAVRIEGKPYSPEKALAFAEEIRAAVVDEDRRRVLVPWEPQFKPGECEGHACCTAKVHEHGCYADLEGKCTDPSDHSTEPEQGREGDKE